MRYPSLIDIGTCDLHMIHGSLKTELFLQSEKLMVL